jgi:hypothetical protein
MSAIRLYVPPRSFLTEYSSSAVYIGFILIVLPTVVCAVNVTFSDKLPELSAAFTVKSYSVLLLKSIMAVYSIPDIFAEYPLEHVITA